MMELEKDCGGQYLQEVKNFIKNIHGINNNQIVVTMDREQAKELLPIIQAFAEGKTIQSKRINGTWIDLEMKTALNIISLIDQPQKYRIKPGPKYRPFKDAEECWQEMQKHQPFGWIKGSGEYKNISGIRATGSYPILINVEHCGEQYENSCNMSEMFKNYTFADGTPFGIKEE